MPYAGAERELSGGMSYTFEGGMTDMADVVICGEPRAEKGKTLRVSRLAERTDDATLVSLARLLVLWVMLVGARLRRHETSPGSDRRRDAAGVALADALRR